MTHAKTTELKKREGALFDRVVSILENARTHVSRTVNSAMVVAYWLIGREIVEEEQQGAERAEYGKALLRALSRRLNERYAGGFSVANLQDFRKLYLTYADRLSIQHPADVELVPDRVARVIEIERPAGVESELPKKLSPVGSELARKGRPTGDELPEKC